MTPSAIGVLRGVPVSEGVVVGPAFVVHALSAEFSSYSIGSREVEGELERFEFALKRAEAEILELLEGINGLSDSVAREVLETHVLVLFDHSLLSEVKKRVQRDLRNVEEVYYTVVEEFAERLSGMEDDLFRERALDFRDVGHRVLRAFKGVEASVIRFPEHPCILVAKELKPSEVVGLDRRKVMGVITEVGGKTSHAAIIARSLGIPMVAGVHGLCAGVVVGRDVFLDGATGEVVLEVDDALRQRVEMERERSGRERAILEGIRVEKAITKDGFHVVLSANMETVAEVSAVRDSGAEGIGLFRTEFIYLEKNDLPTEDEQVSVYRTVADAIQPLPVVLRTLDLGGDKVLDSRMFPEESNPFLGLRAIRLCLRHEEMFRQQLRAMVRVARDRHVRIMYPMVTTVDEVRAANTLLESVCREIGFDGPIEVGAMIEVPAAAMCARSIAREVDFLSIGTNDLVQYTMAADRLNESVSHLYQPAHPAVVKLIEMTARAADEAEISVGICGESAGDLLLTPLFLSLGITGLSVGSALVPRIKAAVRALNRQDCLALREAFLTCESQESVLQLTKQVAQEAYGELVLRSV
jgi:phosphotransferase system enzyme I (PtsI)